MRNRDRHQRLLVLEIGRRKADAAGAGFDELDVAGEIHIAAEGDASTATAGAARGPGCVEKRQLVDGRDLPQQLRIVGAALFERVGRGGRRVGRRRA